MHWSSAAPLFQLTQLHPPADKKPNPHQSCCSASVPNSSKLCDISILQQQQHTQAQVSDASQLEQQDLMMFWLAWLPPAFNECPLTLKTWSSEFFLHCCRPAEPNSGYFFLNWSSWNDAWLTLDGMWFTVWRKDLEIDRQQKKITFLTSKVFHKTSENSLL